MKNKLANYTLYGACALLSASLGCAKPLDTTRQPDSYTSFGDAVYRESCERLAYIGELEQQQAGQRTTVDVSGSLGNSVCQHGMPAPADAPPKVPAIQGQRTLFTNTVDAIFPSPFLPDLQGFMVELLPLQDDDTVPKNVAALATLFQQMHDDPDFPGALERLGVRAGYRPEQVAAGVTHTVVDYPQIDDFLGQVLGMIATGGTANAEWNEVTAALGAELRAATAVTTPADPERTITLALNLMLSTSSELGDGTVRPLAARDYRGVAQGNLAKGPFVDLNGDGLADTDGDGHYLDALGNILTLATPFVQPGVADSAPRDSLGRALVSAGGSDLLYNYLDLDGTVVGGLTREALTLMDPTKDTTLGLVYGASTLLGPRLMQSKVYDDPATGQPAETLSFNGYDTSQAAVLDLAHGFIQLLGDPTPGESDQTMEATGALLGNHESETTRVIKAMFDAHDLGKQHPEALIPVDSVLYDQMAPIITRILRVKGLPQKLLQALENPHVAGLAPMMARLIRARNQVDFDHTDVNGTGGKTYPMDPHALDAEDWVDRTMPDVDYNRSLIQRIAHLIHDANGLQFCNKNNATVAIPVLDITLETKAACQLFKVPDLSLFYILAMASDSVKMDTSTAQRTKTTHDVASFREAIIDPLLHAAILDDSIGDDALQLVVGINGFTRFPTPAAANRSLFLLPSEESSFLQNTIDPVLCTDGDKFTDVHNKSILAWETTLPANPAGAAYANDTWYDAFRPVVDAFASFDECLDANPDDMPCQNPQNAAKILVDLLSLLHEHWTSPQGSYFGHTYQNTAPTQPRFAYPDSIVSYEPLLNLVLGGDMVPSLIGLAPVLDGLTLPSSGDPALPAVFGTARYVFDPLLAPASLSYRSGATTTTWSDGITPVPQVTPYYLLADAYAHKRNALAQATDPLAAQSWAASTTSLIDEMLTIDALPGGTFAMDNRRVHAITLLVIDFLRGRLESPRRAGRPRHLGASDADAELDRHHVGAAVRRAHRFCHQGRGQPDRADLAVRPLAVSGRRGHQRSRLPDRAHVAGRLGAAVHRRSRFGAGGARHRQGHGPQPGAGQHVHRLHQARARPRHQEGALDHPAQRVPARCHRRLSGVEPGGHAVDHQSHHAGADGPAFSQRLRDHVCAVQSVPHRRAAWAAALFGDYSQSRRESRSLAICLFSS